MCLVFVLFIYMLNLVFDGIVPVFSSRSQLNVSKQISALFLPLFGSPLFRGISLLIVVVLTSKIALIYRFLLLFRCVALLCLQLPFFFSISIRAGLAFSRPVYRFRPSNFKPKRLLSIELLFSLLWRWLLLLLLNGIRTHLQMIECRIYKEFTTHPKMKIDLSFDTIINR